MLSLMTRNFRSCWKVLALTDIVFKVAAFVLFTPLVALLFRLFVAASGRRGCAALEHVIIGARHHMTVPRHHIKKAADRLGKRLIIIQ